MLILTCCAVHLIRLILPTGIEYAVISQMHLSVEGVINGKWWQFVTYAMLHGTFLHLFLNMLGLFFLGPELERHMGTGRFLLMFAFCSVLGGLGWFVLTYPVEGACVGASGGIFGLIGAFAALFPHRQITLLVFFVLPVTMPAWLMAVLFGLMQLAYLLNPGASGIAYSAHLAGGIAGYLFVKVMFRKRNRQLHTMRSMFAADSPSSEQIDTILDKVTREGIHTLTPREREQLQKASRRGRGY